MHKLEYLWLDGCTPTQIRYKTKVVKDFGKKEEAPIWGFDGSSTEQADGNNSDCVLKPVRVYPNPLESNSSIVLCEVLNVNDTPHEKNTRRRLNRRIKNARQTLPTKLRRRCPSTFTTIPTTSTIAPTGTTLFSFYFNQTSLVAKRAGCSNGLVTPAMK